MSTRNTLSVTTMELYVPHVAWTLSAVFVEPGQTVIRGQPIGIEGNSGAAGSKHIHFSLHEGDAAVLQPARSLPVRRLRVRGRWLDTLTLRCARGSEGDLVGAEVLVSSTPRVNIAPRIGFRAPARFGLEVAVGKVLQAATRKEGIAILRAAPKEVLARYWLAVGLELDGARAEARALFTALTEEQAGPGWVRRWPGCAWRTCTRSTATSSPPAKH